MHYTSIKEENGLVTIETETPQDFLGFKLKPIKRTFIAWKEFQIGFWNWVEMPNKTMIDSKLSFQLDTWFNFNMRT